MGWEASVDGRWNTKWGEGKTCHMIGSLRRSIFKRLCAGLSPREAARLALQPAAQYIQAAACQPVAPRAEGACGLPADGPARFP